MEKKKRAELHVMTVWMMLLVMLIHITAEAVSGYRPSSVPFGVVSAVHRLSSFVVQGFLFLSGLKAFLPPQKPHISYGRYLFGRFRRVILPYAAAFAVFYLYFCGIGWLRPDAGYAVREFLTGGLVGHFYFVCIIWQFYLLLPLWRWVAEHIPVWLVLLGSAVLMLASKRFLPETVPWFGAEIPLQSRLFTSYLLYFMGGVEAGRQYEALADWLDRHIGWLAAAWGVSGCLTCAVIWLIRNGRYYPAWAEEAHIVYCVTAILFSVALARCPFCLSGEHPAVRRLAGISYTVYLVHPLFLFLTDGLLNRLGVVSLTGRLVLRAAAVYPVTLLFCLLLEKIRQTCVSGRLSGGRNTPSRNT